MSNISEPDTFILLKLILRGLQERIVDLVDIALVPPWKASGLVSKNFHPKLSHLILRHMHGVLNIDEKKLIT